MPTLAFDTATAVGVVAVLDGERVAQRHSPPGSPRHGETLLPLIDDALAAVGVGLPEIDLLAVGVGPGSFTGLRIGLATAQGLRLARQTPALGLCSLQALAAPHALVSAGPVAAVLDAFRGEVYVGVYGPAPGAPGGVAELLAPFSAAPADAAARVLAAVGGDVLFAGDGLQKYREVFDTCCPAGLRAVEAGQDSPCALSLGRHAEQLRDGPGLPGASRLQPIYLRGADAKLPAVPLKL